MAVNKMIVNKQQARKIRDNEKFTLGFDMRVKEGECKLTTARKKFLNNIFWVAEPVRDIKNIHSKAVMKQFACDQIPNDWEAYTVPRHGSRVDKSESRHLVKCTSVELATFSSGSMFTVFVEMEKLK